MTSDTTKRNVADIRATMGTDAKRMDEAGSTPMQKHLAPTGHPALTTEMLDAVGKTIRTIEHIMKEHIVHIEANALAGLIRSVEELRTAFPQVKGVEK